MSSSFREGFVFQPQMKHKVWGGRRLVPTTSQPLPVGEVWVIQEDNVVLAGVHAGKSLAQLTAEMGRGMLGSAAREEKFPLLLKLLDTSDWLSLQVHPNDAQAEQLEGKGQRGKTECWYVLGADPGATLLCGVEPGTTREQLSQDMGTKGLVSRLRSVPVKEGDALLVDAGTAHAIGPGLTLLELQQSSDITYRMYDWDRPAAAGRELHLKQSIAVTDLSLCPAVLRAPAGGNGTVVESPKFHLDALFADRGSVQLDTGLESFHAITVTEGTATVTTGSWTATLKRFETALIPASAGAYLLEASPSFRALRSRL